MKDLALTLLVINHYDKNKYDFLRTKNEKDSLQKSEMQIMG